MRFQSQLYPEPGSNRHALRHWCLRPTRLPIPPSGLIVTLLARAKVNIICDLQFTICNFFSFHTHFCSFSYRLEAEKNRERWQMRPDVWADATRCMGRYDQMYGPIRPDAWADATGCVSRCDRTHKKAHGQKVGPVRFTIYRCVAYSSAGVSPASRSAFFFAKYSGRLSPA